MIIYFIQNFTRCLTIALSIKWKKIKNFFKPVISLDRLLTKSMRRWGWNTNNRSRLKGRSSILRAIELYYNQLEGLSKNGYKVIANWWKIWGWHWSRAEKLIADAKAEFDITRSSTTYKFKKDWTKRILDNNIKKEFIPLNKMRMTNEWS